ncbi:MAG: hypothetical protein WBK47_00670, partial [Acetomicrobium sp.]
MKDFKIEMGRWKRKMFTATVVGVFVFLLALFFFFSSWILDEWIDIVGSTFILNDKRQQGTVLA